MLIRNAARYALHTLAVTLGMKILAQQCLSRLSTDTESMIEAAFSQGFTLQQILGFSSDAEAQDEVQGISVDNVVQVVFMHVLKDEKPPKRLVDLVTYALAEYLDPSLWERLTHTINHRVSLLLIKAMIDRRQVNFEAFEELDAKSENVSTGDEQAHFTLNEQARTE
jgi:hypothetical protein